MPTIAAARRFLDEHLGELFTTCQVTVHGGVWVPGVRTLTARGKSYRFDGSRFDFEPGMTALTVDLGRVVLAYPAGREHGPRTVTYALA